MILMRISNYLRERQRASLQDMAHGLDAAPDALREMLAVLERKGRVRRLPSGTPCGGGCCKCKPSDIELYEWSDTAESSAPAGKSIALIKSGSAPNGSCC